MFQKNKKLKTKIWIYLIIFSILILSFLWLFQVIFLDDYYKWSKTNDINKIADKVKNNYSKDNYSEVLDHITFEEDVCIEISNNNVLTYSSNTFRRGCFDEIKDLNNIGFKYNFENGSEERKIFKTNNPRFNNETLILALKLDENSYAYITTSLEPVGALTKIFAKQLIIVTIIVLLVSLVIGYFMSKKLSSPILKISNEASKLGKEGNANFDTNSDIEEIKELSLTLNKAQEELSKTETLRRELMANVSHDLKTPLTMIKAYAEMVRDLTYKNKEKREQNLNVIIDETDRLNILVNDILELSKMQSGTDNLKLEQINLKDLINNIVKNFDILVEKNEITFNVNIDKDYIIKADKKKMEQLIYNLINNATGYANAITINVYEKNKIIRVEISDNGKGIKKEDLEIIWEKYYKTDKTHRREVKGTGLGLSIVKNIFIQHGFKYGVDSVINKGTTFWFEIKK